MTFLPKLLVSSTILISSAASGASGMSQDNPHSTAKSHQIPDSLKAQLPAPPANFSWAMFQNALFAKPTAWQEHEKTRSEDGISMQVYATSGEAFSESKQFETGFTVQIISGFKKARNMQAKQMVLAYLRPFVQAHAKEDIQIFEQNKKGENEMTFFRFRDAPPGLKPIIVHKYIIASDSSDTVHVFTFESPEASWKENWDKFGTPILQRINLLATAPGN